MEIEPDQRSIQSITGYRNIGDFFTDFDMYDPNNPTDYGLQVTAEPEVALDNGGNKNLDNVIYTVEWTPPS